MNAFKRSGLLVLFASLSMLASCIPHRSPMSASVQSIRLELPQKTESDVVINHSFYTVSYNPTTLIPNWVAYELTAEETDGPWTRKGLRFMPDPDCVYPQATNDDFRNSGYSRGHLVPAGDMKWDSVAMLESFYFTNCMPQDEKLNNGKWNQLEMKTRSLAQRYGRVFVVTGPVFLNEDTIRIGVSGVAVPDACFKALMIPKAESYSAIAFIMSNRGENKDMRECFCTVDSLETLLSLDFFANLSDRVEAFVEGVVIREDWGL